MRKIKIGFLFYALCITLLCRLEAQEFSDKAQNAILPKQRDRGLNEDERFTPPHLRHQFTKNGVPHPSFYHTRDINDKRFPLKLLEKFTGPEGDQLERLRKRSLEKNGDCVQKINECCIKQNISTKATQLSDTLVPEWVNHYVSGLLPSGDYVSATAIDNSGNVYVTGSSDSALAGSDYTTIKYNSSGVEQWVARYNGQSNAYDRATAISVDNSGNVYVTGYSFGPGYNSDYATIKYNSSGVEQWVTRYNGPGNFANDCATAISVDNSGNVYVTGFSDSSGTNYDYATIKYNSSGEEQWVARYNGPGNSDDWAAAISVDNSGNVYVTGFSYDLGTNNDYTTIKYNSSGVKRWVARYNGPGNGYDYSTAISVDNSGNVYVTGYSYDLGTNNDYTTIKYNSSGVKRWVARYNGQGNADDRAIAMSVDGSGNVYVTGYSDSSGTNYDYATIKYNSSGVEQWVARYNGQGNADDRATAILVDGLGNVYVTGYSDGSEIEYDYATIKYNSSGVEQWVTRYNGPGNSDDQATAISLDNSGNVYVTGRSVGSGTGYDYATIKYNSSGAEQWIARYDGPGGAYDNATATAISIDGSGNVYVTGYSEGSGTYCDYATIKYNSSGVEQWVARYNGQGNAYDWATAISVDGYGNVYVTGFSNGSGTYYDYATIKYNSSGVEQWVARYNGSGNSDDQATAISVDDSGNIYVTGFSVNSVTSSDYATIKYNSSGEEQWIAKYNGPGNGYDYSTAISVDDSGNVYVTGCSYGSGTSTDYATIKYNSSGVEQWAARYNGLGDGYDWANTISVDGSGNVYVTGSSYGSGTSDDYATIKYNSSGVELWVARYNGSGDAFDRAIAISVDGSDNVYVTGNSWGAGTSDDYTTIKYNSSGVEQWVARYNGPGNSDDQATAISVDGYGNVYVTGKSLTSGFDYDYTTIKYNSIGVEQWISIYNGPRNTSDCARAMLVDSLGNVYVTGASGNICGSVYTTIKYFQQPKFVSSINNIIFNEKEISCRLSQSLIISNAGNAALFINSVFSDDSNFTVTPKSISINPGDSALITINFSPLSAGLKSGNIIFTYNAKGSPDTVTVNGIGVGEGSGILISKTFDTRWQLISLPVFARCPYTPGGLFEYNGVYVLRDTIENGVGYWKKMNEPCINFVGYPIEVDTIDITSGWNMIGSISYPVLTSGILKDPEDMITSTYFGYNGAYGDADTIKPGCAYWVKANKPGKIILKKSAILKQSEQPSKARTLFDQMNTLTILDDRGRYQTLYFGDTLITNLQLEKYEVPPIPPDGIFDVRFRSQRTLEIFQKGDAQEFPIIISSAKYPVTVSWDMKYPSVSSFLIVEGKEHLMNYKGAIQISNPKSRAVLVTRKAFNVPREFSLDQNYPDPFNPITVIRYSLPMKSLVTLKVYNILGQEVVILLNNESIEVGSHEKIFEANNLPSGIYFYRLIANGVKDGSNDAIGKSFVSVKKMMLLK